MSLRRARLFGSLARLTGAGVPVVKAGEFMKSRLHGTASKAAVQALEDGIARGESIAEAMRPTLTDLEYRMVGAAESGGRLSAGFSHLERYHTLMAGARSRMVQAAIYPLLILHVAALTTGVTAHLAGRPPLPAISLSLGVLWAFLTLAWFGGRMFLRLARTSSGADALLRALPLAGSAWKHLALARWSAVMHFHIISGRNFSLALEAAADACASASLAAATRRMATAAADGRDISDAISGERIFPEGFAASLAAAEATGTLDTETSGQMNLCMEEATADMTLLAEWLPRLLYLAALGLGAWQVLRMASSIAGFYQNLLK